MPAQRLDIDPRVTGRGWRLGATDKTRSDAQRLDVDPRAPRRGWRLGATDKTRNQRPSSPKSDHQFLHAFQYFCCRIWGTLVPERTLRVVGVQRTEGADGVLTGRCVRR
jgi:hypothetical protein